jgi:hypothetical protein
VIIVCDDNYATLCRVADRGMRHAVTFGISAAASCDRLLILRSQRPRSPFPFNGVGPIEVPLRSR